MQFPLTHSLSKMADTDTNTNIVNTTKQQQQQPQQISEMFQKFALAFKSKTYELFSEDQQDHNYNYNLVDSDSADEIIPDQKVVVIKPDKPQLSTSSSPHNLVATLFATLSSFEASYVQLQTAHVPFNEDAVVAADKALVATLKKLSSLKDLSFGFNGDLGIGNWLEAQVEENQNKLRALETVSNRLQEEIDCKDEEVVVLRKRLCELELGNSRLARRLMGLDCEVRVSVGVFCGLLRDVFKECCGFGKVLVGLMRKAGWDLGLVGKMVYPDVEFRKQGDLRVAVLSYVCLGMFRGFDLVGYGVVEEEENCGKKNGSSLKELVEHVSSNPMEVLSRDGSCEFSKFCERKYQELIHPTMESSIFSGLDKKEAVLNSWRSLSVFYESYVNMASSIWALHKLAFSFDPVVEIFQIERGVEFSMVYMEDVRRRSSYPDKTRPKVGFTVVPGFKIGRTVIQSQVYLVA